MKKIILILVLTLGFNSFSQILKPVKWSTSVEKISETEYNLIATATIDSGWHLYSQKVPEGGPIPTTFHFENNQDYGLIKKVSEEEGHTVNDPVFNMRIKFFENKAAFKQRIKVLNSELLIVKGEVEFMVCDDTRCLAPSEVDLVFNIPDKTDKTDKTDKAKRTDKVDKVEKVDKTDKVKRTDKADEIDKADKNNNKFNSQEGMLNPVKWSTSVEKISEDEFYLIMKATINENWHIYSQYTADGGSLPIVITKHKETDDYDLKGKALESETIKKFNEIFKVTETFFDDEAVLKQRIKLNKSDVSKVTLNLTGQVCKQVCLQIDEAFTFSLNDNSQNTNTPVAPSVDNTIVNKKLYGMTPDNLSVSSVKCEDEVTSNASAVQSGGKSLWSIFGLGFLGGLLALITPCVFPMIPLTVSFFTKNNGQNKNSGISKALLYGFFIFAVYIILSVPFHLLDSVNPDILNEISTNIWLNIIFFAIFLFFAFSFFGYYELTLPASWTNKTTQGESSGGFVGIFFMALTLAIVSFSCTGPILGSLLAGSLTADGGAWQLTAGMAGFGVSLGLPFALFAMFPNMMNALPKSGGWLNTTKVILGFLELALAFKFLSNADLVAHWNLLKIEPFLIIWIIIFGGLALYLFGKIKFPHDSPIKKLSFSRISGGILVAAFTIYLVSGFRVNKETNTFTPLTLLSGLAPPVGYSFLYPNGCPNNLECFKDLKTGIAYAKKVNKPIMLDFTGYACVNCRKMEEHVWPLKKIDNYLRSDFVLISLYVDDKKALPEAEQLNVNRVNGGTRKLENYGHKWANFQTQFFQTNSQPYYVLLNADGTKILNQAVGYTPNEEDYAKFLECGLSVFESIKN